MSKETEKEKKLQHLKKYLDVLNFTIAKTSDTEYCKNAEKERDSVIKEIEDLEK